MSIWRCAERNDVTKLKRLLSQNVVVNSLNRRHQTALYVACEAGHSEIAKILLQRGASVNLGVKPLIVATKNGHKLCVRLLLKYGASVHTTNSEGHSVILVACQYKHYSIVELLLDSGAEAITDYEWIASLGSEQANLAKKLLDRDPLPVTGCLNDGFLKGLHTAFKTGIKELVHRMLSSGRASSNEDYSFALYYCAKHNWPDLMLQLLNEGLNADSISVYHNSQTALYCACEQGHRNIVELLIQSGASTNACNESRFGSYSYPLQIAAVRGDIEVVRILTRNGASLCYYPQNKRVSSTELPIHLAYDNGHMDIVELLATQSDYDHMINIRDSNEETLLHKAARLCRVEDVAMLLSLGARADCVNLLGESAIYFALTYACKQDESYTTHASSTLSTGEGVSVMLTDDEFRCEEQIAAVVGALVHNDELICNSRCSRENETPLYIACERGLVKLVKLLLNAGCVVEVNNSAKQPLLIACEKGYFEIVELLLNTGADVSLGTVNSESAHLFLTTPLCTAVKHRRVGIVEMLLEYQADVGLRDNFEMNSVDYVIDELVRTKGSGEYADFKAILQILLAAKTASNIHATYQYCELYSTPLYRVCLTGLSDIVECFVPNDICQDDSTGQYFHQSLAAACINNHEDVVQLLLARVIELPSEIACHWLQPSASNLLGHDLLRAAAVSGNASIVSMLIDFGADVKQTDHLGFTVLHVASNAAVATVLIEGGADVNALSNGGVTPLYAACAEKHVCVAIKLLEIGATPNPNKPPLPLDIACKLNLNRVVSALLTYGADPNFMIGRCSWKSTPQTRLEGNALCFACKNYNVGIVRELMAHGALGYVLDSDGNTPLHLAIIGLNEVKMERGVVETDIIELLLSESHKWVVNKCNIAGHTALFLAVEANLVAAVNLLIEHGADTNLTKCGRYPLVAACKRSFIDVAELLLNGSANPNVWDAVSKPSTPLCIAVNNVDDRLVDLLINCGADANYFDGDGLMPLHRAVDVNTSVKINQTNKEFSHSLYAKMMRIVSSLLEAGACIDVHGNCADGPLNTKQTNKQTNVHGNDNKIGRTPLYTACGRSDAYEKDYQLVKLLLSKDANPNFPLRIAPNLSSAICPFAARNECVRLPLSHAVRSKKIELVRLLLESGARTDNIERNYSSVLHLAIDEIQHSDRAKRLACKETLCKKPLFRESKSKVPLPKSRRATKSSSLEPCNQPYDYSFIKLLLYHGADVNKADHKGQTPLYKACTSNMLCLARILLEHGADVNQPDIHGKTALQYVVAGNIQTTVTEQVAARDLLLSHKADPNKLDNFDESPMFVACKNGCTENVREMLKYGGNPNSITPSGGRLLITACRNRDSDMTDLLLAAGADLSLSSNIAPCVTKKRKRKKNIRAMQHDGASQNPSNVFLSNFFLPVCHKNKIIFRLFKAGACVSLLKDICRSVGTVCAPLSGQLCQAIVLAGYRIRQEDLKDLSRFADGFCPELRSWLKEDKQKPASLMRQCRIAVRRQLLFVSGHCSILPLFDYLPIPDELQSYLRFEGPLEEVDLTC